MGRSRGFGSIPCDCTPYSDSVSLRLRRSCDLTLPQKITRRLIMQKARRQLAPPTACRQTVSGSLSLPSPGFFSPFPHGTGSLSVIEEYLALPDGPGRFTPGSTCPVLLGILLNKDKISCTGLSPSLDNPSRSFHYPLSIRTKSHNPRGQVLWFGLLHFRSPLLAESLFCFLFLQVLRWFNSLGSLPSPMYSATDTLRWVAPFGYPRIKAHLAAPRGFSQPNTSFIASRCLGIHCLPLLRL